MKVIDCTLREGNQSPNVIWGNRESYHISQGLVDYGVDCIEVGHPYASKLDRENVGIVTAANPNMSILAHARAVESDITAVKESGANWVGIFMATNKIARSFKFRNKSTDDILDQIEASIRYAKLLQLQVRFTLEDTSRTDLDLQIKAYERALRAGADRICYSDTVGILQPYQAASALAKLRNFFPTSSIEVHFHNDRGLALANALAVENYADWVSTSVNGIGERCGITDTIAYMSNLSFNERGTVSSEEIAKSRSLSQIVHAFGRNSVIDRAPIVGEFAFTHCSKLHRSAYKKSNRAYCWLPDFEGQAGHENVPLDLGELVKTDVEIEPGIENHLTTDSYYSIGQTCTVTQIKPSANDMHPFSDLKSLNCDSLFLLFGCEDGKSGLNAAVFLNGERFELQSPASLFVPSGVEYCFESFSGAGLVINHVLNAKKTRSLMNLRKPHIDFDTQPLSALVEQG
ncbi:hypothetical protein GCM10007385_31640 [Tateyamaria omphalii]|uniref:LeuA family protein n=1 Tax=Tateyamaria omphalii TaxID=299262 RepID=UPI001677B023|nr:LeuA family protein [Tateyamaria omphalii]GGX60062.1 hypothetical protein GCM10007385_31640 [Tateyamaria omphalii]